MVARNSAVESPCGFENPGSTSVGGTTSNSKALPGNSAGGNWRARCFHADANPNTTTRIRVNRTTIAMACTTQRNCDRRFEVESMNTFKAAATKARANTTNTERDAKYQLRV